MAKTQSEKMNEKAQEFSKNEDGPGSNKLKETKKEEAGSKNSTIQGQSRHLARKSTLSLGSNVLITLFGLVSLIFVKRYMGYQAVGILAFSIAFCQMFSIVGDLGFSSTHLKRVGEGLDPALANGTYLTVKALLTLLMGATIFIWLFIQKHVFNYQFSSEEQEVVLYLIIVQYMLLNIGMSFKTVFSARLEIAKANIPHTTGRFTVMAGKVLVALTGLSVLYLGGAELLGTFAMLLFYLLLFKGIPIKKTNWQAVKYYTSFALPMVFIGFVGSLAYNVDKVMLGYLANAEEVGIYTIPQRIAVTLLLISTTLTTILFVVFSESYQKKQFSEIREISARSEKYISIFTLPFIVFLFIFGKESLILVFGEDSSASFPVLEIMLVALYLETTMNPYHVQIVATGNLKAAGWIAVLVLLLNILLDFILVPDEIGGLPAFGLGAKGAAISTLTALSLRAVLVRVVAFSITGSKPNKRILLHIFVATISGITLYLLSREVGWHHWLLLFIYAPLLIALYLGLLRLVGEFTKEDLRFYMDTLNLGKMKSYVLKEMKR